MNFELEIDRLLVETDGPDHALQDMSNVVREAMEQLSKHLEETPFARWGGARQVLVEELRLSGLSTDELLGPRGAARLAEELYRQLLRQGNGGA